jgi:hypothetical protein
VTRSCPEHYKFVRQERRHRLNETDGAILKSPEGFRMNATSRTGQAGAAATPIVMPLQVHVFYEDFATGLRAKFLLDRLTHRLETLAEFSVHWCRFDLLRLAPLRDAALPSAAAADLVLVSAHADTTRFAEFESSSNQWTLNRGRRSAALVLVLDDTARNSGPGQRALLRFHAVAARAGMTLFSYFGNLPFQAPFGHQPRWTRERPAPRRYREPWKPPPGCWTPAAGEASFHPAALDEPRE